MNEIYKIIKDFPDYEVSNLGNVRNLKTGKVLNLCVCCKYLYVSLYRNGKHKYCRVHRLVAEAFIPNPLGLPEVNHINEDKEDNRAENLEWCTNQYNTEYSQAKQVGQYDLSGNLIKVWKSTREIERQTGFFESNISACCRGIYKTAYNFIWKYL